MDANVTDKAKWYVLHVRPRCEKKMAEYAAARGLEYYLPLRKDTKIYQRRRVTVEKPVFTGYVFIVFDDEQRLTVLKSNQIVRILDVTDQARLIHELAQIRMALGVDPTLGACEAFRKGRHVRIKGGPFMGLEGVVATVRGQARVLLNVEMIGQAVAVEAAMELLEATD